MPAKKGKPKIRVNYRLSPKLVVWAKKYATKKQVTVTEIVERALQSLKEVDDGRF